jgi:peroxiredoxin
MRRLALLVLLTLAGCRAEPRPALDLGAAAPDFSLPGVDGRTHGLAEFTGSQAIAIVFTCNRCPASQLYERRIQALYDAYHSKGVAIVAINPDAGVAAPPEQLAYSDVGETIADMKIRASHQQLAYPYLADDASQKVTSTFGVRTVPHVFVFDRDRKLRYEGRLDDNVREGAARMHETRDAIDALLASRPVAVAHTRVAGCPVLSGDGSRSHDTARNQVSLEMATPPVLKKLRANGTDKLTLVNFWATWCGPCAVEFPDLVMTSQMYKSRNVEFVSVSENQPEERPLVLEFLRRNQAANRNLLFAAPETYEMQAAFDPAMPAAVPFTLVIAPNGDVVYQELGSLDVLKLRRAILANLPDDAASAGTQQYWANGNDAKKG